MIQESTLFEGIYSVEESLTLKKLLITRARRTHQWLIKQRQTEKKC